MVVKLTIHFFWALTMLQTVYNHNNPDDVSPQTIPF